MIKGNILRFLCDYVSPKKYKTYMSNLPEGYVIKHDDDFTVTSVERNGDILTVNLMDKETNKNYLYNISIEKGL